MKKVMLILLSLMFVSELKAQRYSGVDPCAGPGLRRTIIDSASPIVVSTESFAGAGGGLFCDAVISSGAVSISASPNDYVVCLDSRPVTASSTATVVGAVTAVSNAEIGITTDTRIIFPALVSSSAALTSLPVGFPAYPFVNLYCELSNIRTPAAIYWVPSVR